MFKDGADALRRIDGATGIVYIRQFVGVTDPSYRWDHIDLWNGSRFGKGYREWITNSPIYVWFWPIR